MVTLCVLLQQSKVVVEEVVGPTSVPADKGYGDQAGEEDGAGGEQPVGADVVEPGADLVAEKEAEDGVDSSEQPAGAKVVESGADLDAEEETEEEVDGGEGADGVGGEHDLALLLHRGGGAVKRWRRGAARARGCELVRLQVGLGDADRVDEAKGGGGNAQERHDGELALG